MKIAFYFSILIALLFVSCEDEPNPNNVSINIEFKHLVDNSPAELDQMIYTNALGQGFSVRTLKYFVSGFKIYNIDGSFITFDDIHYIDIRDAETFTLTLDKKIAPGEYSGIGFIHGLAKEENITGQFTEQPESLMEWPEMMGGGYHYMKLEGDYSARSSEGFYNFHSGALEGKEYEINIDLVTLPFEVSNELNLEIEMEIQNWFTNPTDWDFTYFGPAIMGNKEAQETVQRNGKDVYSFSIIENN